jgi:XTP/dITP diphosphohydrolase
VIKIEPMPGLGAIAAPDEDGDTFEGNARIKAIYYSSFAPGEIVIADDSGLEVDALGGAPGVRSARYADDCGFRMDGSVDERNNQSLIGALGGMPPAARSARYRCALVAARDGIVLATGHGVVEGRILEAPRGSGGFGYDPYFMPEGEALSMAELQGARRMNLSHRGRALSDLLPKLDSIR